MKRCGPRARYGYTKGSWVVPVMVAARFSRALRTADGEESGLEKERSERDIEPVIV